MSPNGTYILAGQPSKGRWLGALAGMVKMIAASPWSGSKKMLPFLATAKKEDLVTLRALIEAGKMTPVIERSFP